MSTITVTADQLNPGGAKRLAALLVKGGLKANHAKCPQCGGKITAADYKNLSPAATRYSISCGHDCECAFAPTVRSLVKTWAALFPATPVGGHIGAAGNAPAQSTTPPNPLAQVAEQR